MHSLSFSSRGDQQPLFWLSGHPIYAVPLLISLYAAATIAVALLLAAGRHDLVQLFVYNSTAVAHGELWRIVTYPLINPPSLWFALEVGMLYYFGRLVEFGIGSKTFALFYGGSILLQGVLFQLTSLLSQITEAHGMQMVNMALFAAFVAMYPSASFFFGIAARWMLLLLLGLSSLQFLAEHQWASIVQLLTLSLVAILFMKTRGYHERLYFFSSGALETITKRSNSTPVSLPPPKHDTADRYFTGSTLIASLPKKNRKKPLNPSLTASQKETKSDTSMLHVDVLLDKINRTGLHSLTDQEREKLEAARLALLQQDREIGI